MLRKLLKSKKAESHLDIVIGVIALTMFIVVALNIFAFVSLKTTMDRIADNLIEVATYSGAFDDDFALKVEQLKTQYFDFQVDVYAEEYFNAEHKRVQMGEKMGITITVNSSVAGIDIALPVNLTVSRVGQSEQYWRIASGTYEDSGMGYTENALYVINTNTNKFHYPYCSALQGISESNKKEVYFTAAELIEYGYLPCLICNAHDCSANAVTHFNIYGHWGFCETCGRQNQIEEHWWSYDENTDIYYCEYCEAIEDQTGYYCCSGGSKLTEVAHLMGCGCYLTPPTLSVSNLSTDSANPTIFEQCGTFRITGHAKDREGAILRVVVNGENAHLDVDGKWYYDLRFDNTTSSVITIVAIDEDGMETSLQCYAELPVVMVTITQGNKYEIMDAIGVDYTIDGYPLTIPEYYFVGDTKYKIVGIGDAAFDCERVGDVYIAGENRSYFTIGESAFADSSIYRIRFDSDKIKEIGDSAFYMSDIKYAYLPNADVYGSMIFGDCEYLKEVDLPDDLTYIAPAMFMGCEQLWSIDLKNVKEIKERAFENSGIESIDLSNVTHIYSEAFANCKNMLSVTIPKLTVWDSYVFLHSIHIERVTIKSGNICIPEGSFMGCASLESVSCPNSTIQEIGPYAFLDCGRYMPSTWIFKSPLTTIGDYAFFGCYGITEFIFNKEIKYIGEHAFYVEDKIETILSGTITDAVKKYDWTSDNRIVEMAAGIYYENGDFISWSDATKAGYVSVSYNILQGTDSYAMFSDGDRPGRIVLPNEITVINNNAFNSCAGLIGISMNKDSDLTFIGNNAFRAAPDLRDVVLSDNVQYIGQYAFGECRLKAITLPSKLQEIGAYAFAENDFSEICIPATVGQINEGAFYANSSLTTIILEGEVSWIGANAFYVDTLTQTCIQGIMTEAVNNYDWKGSGRYLSFAIINLPPDDIYA